MTPSRGPGMLSVPVKLSVISTWQPAACILLPFANSNRFVQLSGKKPSFKTLSSSRDRWPCTEGIILRTKSGGFKIRKLWTQTLPVLPPHCVTRARGSTSLSICACSSKIIPSEGYCTDDNNRAFYPVGAYHLVGLLLLLLLLGAICLNLQPWLPFAALPKLCSRVICSESVEFGVPFTLNYLYKNPPRRYHLNCGRVKMRSFVFFYHALTPCQEKTLSRSKFLF